MEIWTHLNPNSTLVSRGTFFNLSLVSKEPVGFLFSPSFRLIWLSGPTDVAEISHSYGCQHTMVSSVYIHEVQLREICSSCWQRLSWLGLSLASICVIRRFNICPTTMFTENKMQNTAIIWWLSFRLITISFVILKWHAASFNTKPGALTLLE